MGWGVGEVQSDDGGCFLVMGIRCVDHSVGSSGTPTWDLGGGGCALCP